MSKWLIKNKWTLLGILSGSIGGYLYWYFVGCNSGTCMITSKPINSSLYGGVLGYFVSEMVAENRKTASKNLE